MMDDWSAWKLAFFFTAGAVGFLTLCIFGTMLSDSIVNALHRRRGNIFLSVSSYLYKFRRADFNMRFPDL